MLLAFAKVILTPFLGCKGLQGVITLSRGFGVQDSGLCWIPSNNPCWDPSRIHAAGLQWALSRSSGQAGRALALRFSGRRHLAFFTKEALKLV